MIEAENKIDELVKKHPDFFRGKEPEQPSFL